MCIVWRWCSWVDCISAFHSANDILTACSSFRDGEDIDELLERQSDMIRYLQQHNASLGRRIMELQSRVPPEWHTLKTIKIIITLWENVLCLYRTKGKCLLLFNCCCVLSNVNCLYFTSTFYWFIPSTVAYLQLKWTCISFAGLCKLYPDLHIYSLVENAIEVNFNHGCIAPTIY